MATKKVYDLAVAVGKYTKDGKEKNRYQNIGIVMEKDDGGRFIILEPWFNPAGVAHEEGRGIMVSMFDANKDGKQSGGQSGGFDENNPPF